MDTCRDPVKTIQSAFHILTGKYKGDNEVPSYSCTDGGEVVGFLDDSTSGFRPLAQLLSTYGYPQDCEPFAVIAVSNKNSFYCSDLEFDEMMSHLKSSYSAHTALTHRNNGEDSSSFGVWGKINYEVDEPNLKMSVLSPTTYRFIPDNQAQYEVLVKFLKFFKWNWVGIITEVNKETGLSELRKLMAEHEICIEFIIYLSDKNVYSKMSVVDQSSTNVTLILIHYSMLYAQLFDNSKVLQDNMTIIFHESWATRFMYRPIYLNYGLSFKVYRPILPKVQIWINNVTPSTHQNDPLLQEIWFNVFLCASNDPLQRYMRHVQYTDPDGRKISLNGRRQVTFLLKLVNWKQNDGTYTEEVIAYVKEKQENLLENKEAEKIKWKNGKQTNKEGASSPFKAPAAILQVHGQKCKPYTDKLEFQGSRKAPNGGHHVCCYNCVPCSKDEVSNTTDSEICHKCPEDEWPDEKKVKCIPKTYEFLSYEKDILVSVFIIISLFLCIITLFILAIFIHYWDTPIVKANNRTVSFILLVSILLSFLCVFFFLGRPVDITCLLRQVSFGIFFTLGVSSILAKTITVCIAFKATKPGSSWVKWLSFKVSNYVVLVCSSVQVLICVIWLLVSPPYVEYNHHTYPGKIIIQCNEGSDICFYSMLGYMGLLAAVSFVLAFMVRTLPDSFNEAKYITFSMLLFCSVWIAMIPAYLSTSGKYMVATELFAILSSCAGVVGCIFCPKLYVLIIKTELNSRNIILDKIRR
ncbi:vomeronasal type-2 receptor 26-like [Engystomops pustulosus]|uniref:vomeronasal type-2 receptor 26-like n=1 Tax=Engystomops pustulosus TaxID=76066 RepID=UPI003AFADC8B